MWPPGVEAVGGSSCSGTALPVSSVTSASPTVPCMLLFPKPAHGRHLNSEPPPDVHDELGLLGLSGLRPVWNLSSSDLPLVAPGQPSQKWWLATSTHIPSSLLCLHHAVYRRVLWDRQKLRPGLSRSLLHPSATGLHEGLVLGPSSVWSGPASLGLLCHAVPRMCSHLPASVTPAHNKGSVSAYWDLTSQATLPLCPKCSVQSGDRPRHPRCLDQDFQYTTNGPFSGICSKEEEGHPVGQ